MLVHGSMRPWVVAVALSGFAHAMLIYALPGQPWMRELPFLPVELLDRPAPPPPIEEPRPTPVARPTPRPEPPPPPPPRPRERESPAEIPVREVTPAPEPPVKAPPIAPPPVDTPPAPAITETPRVEPAPAPAANARDTAGPVAAEGRRAPSTEAPGSTPRPGIAGPPSDTSTSVANARPPAQGPAADSARSTGTSPEGITRWAHPRGGYQVHPTYPASARRSGIQGTARLRVQVLADGRVGEVMVENSAGHPDLDRAAADAVRRWRFEPARKGDEPVASWVLLPVEFRLERAER